MAEFPEWKGYSSIKDKQIEYIKQLYDNDINSLTKGLYETFMRESYFKDMLLYIQERLDRHVYNDEPLGLCLDSAMEMFDIMIRPCEKVRVKKRKE